MTVRSGKADSLMQPCADSKIDVRKSLGKLIPQDRDHRRFGAEMISVDQIDAEFPGTKKFVILHIGGYIGITAKRECGVHTIAS